MYCALAAVGRLLRLGGVSLRRRDRVGALRRAAEPHDRVGPLVLQRRRPARRRTPTASTACGPGRRCSPSRSGVTRPFAPTMTVAKVGTNMMKPSLIPIRRSRRYPTSDRRPERGPAPACGRLLTSPPPYRARASSRAPVIDRAFSQAGPPRFHHAARRKRKPSPASVDNGSGAAVPRNYEMYTIKYCILHPICRQWTDISVTSRRDRHGSTRIRVTHPFGCNESTNLPYPGLMTSLMISQPLVERDERAFHRINGEPLQFRPAVPKCLATAATSRATSTYRSSAGCRC